MSVSLYISLTCYNLNAKHLIVISNTDIVIDRDQPTGPRVIYPLTWELIGISGNDTTNTKYL